MELDQKHPPARKQKGTVVKIRANGSDKNRSVPRSRPSDVDFESIQGEVNLKSWLDGQRKAGGNKASALYAIVETVPKDKNQSAIMKARRYLRAERQAFTNHAQYRQQMPGYREHHDPVQTRLKSQMGDARPKLQNDEPSAEPSSFRHLGGPLDNSYITEQS